MTTGILVSVKMKNRLYKDYLKDPTNEKLLTFKEYRNRLNKIKRYAERAYYEKEFEQINGNMKRTWIKINESLGHKKEKDQIKMMNFSEKIVNDPKEIAENLCKYFSEEGSKLCHEAVKRSKSPPVPKLKPRHVTSEFLFTNCDENEINEIIMRMKFTILWSR